MIYHVQNCYKYCKIQSVMRRATFTVVMMSRPISLSLSRRFSLLGQLNSALRLFFAKVNNKK